MWCANNAQFITTLCQFNGLDYCHTGYYIVSLAYMFPGDTLTNISGIVPQSNEQRVALEAVFKLDRSIFCAVLVLFRKSN